MSLMVSVSGIRGIIGETLTDDVVRTFAGAYAAGCPVGSTIVLGRDGRPSGAGFANVAAEAITAAGCHVCDLDIVSTPAAALVVRSTQAAGGLLITASHNPPEWNGLKFFTPEGQAPSQRHAEPIWQRREAGEFRVVDDDHKGRRHRVDDAVERHIAAVLKHVDTVAVAQRRFKVVLDSNHGAGGHEGKLLLAALGCTVEHMGGTPDGAFDHAPEPTEENLRDLAKAVPLSGAHVGFAQDPDADRLAIVDETGRFIGEEYTLALAARMIFKRMQGVAAANLSCSRMIDDLAQATGCTVIRTPVGEAHVAECIVNHGCILGGEGNGGVIEPRIGMVRDSLVAMSLTLQLMAEEQRPLSEIVDDMPRYTMIKRKFPCAREQVAAALEALQGKFDDARVNDADGIRLDWPEGWVHIRGSNTEPIIRVISEARDEDQAAILVERVMEAVGGVVGA